MRYLINHHKATPEVCEELDRPFLKIRLKKKICALRPWTPLVLLVNQLIPEKAVVLESWESALVRK